MVYAHCIYIAFFFTLAGTCLFDVGLLCKRAKALLHEVVGKNGGQTTFLPPYCVRGEENGNLERGVTFGGNIHLSAHV